MTRNDRHSEAAEDPSVAGTPEEIAAREVENAFRQLDRLRELIREAVSGGSGLRLRPSTLMELNRLAIEGIHPRAGAYRTVPSNIGGSRHEPPAWEKVPALVDDLCDYVNNPSAKSPVHLAAYVMWRLNWIHPFYDGNGRTTRAASYLVLCGHLGYELPGANSIPGIIAANKAPYYGALEFADDAHAAGQLNGTRPMEDILEGALTKQLAHVLSEARQKASDKAGQPASTGVHSVSHPHEGRTGAAGLGRKSRWSAQPKWRKRLITIGGALLFLASAAWQLVINWDNSTITKIRSWILSCVEEKNSE